MLLVTEPGARFQKAAAGPGVGLHAHLPEGGIGVSYQLDESDLRAG